MKATALRATSSPVPPRSMAGRKFPASFSWSPIPASAAMPTSTSSGTARRTTFLRSTISGIARASSTCRTRSAPSLRNGAADATILRCSTAALMDTPIKQIVHRPEAQAGLGCMMCHSIANVKSTMGQGDFYLEYPKLHELAASKNPIVRTLARFPGQAESGAAPPRFPETVHARPDAGVLLQLP